MGRFQGFCSFILPWRGERTDTAAGNVIDLDQLRGRVRVRVVCTHPLLCAWHVQVQ